MFSQVCVKNSVHNWRGGVHPLDRHPPPLDTHTRYADTPWTHPLPLGRHPWEDTTPLDSHCSGRYASYWNAFLFTHDFIITIRQHYHFLREPIGVVTFFLFKIIRLKSGIQNSLQWVNFNLRQMYSNRYNSVADLRGVRGTRAP